MQLRWLVWVGLVAACGQVETSSPDAAPRQMRTVTIAITGSGIGTITSSPAGIDCGTDCTEAFPDGAQITLTATPAPGSTFMGWGDGSCAGTGDCVITVGQDISIAPTFALANSIVVTIAGNGTGAVASTPAGITCPGDCSEQYGPGQSVTLTATAGDESVFAGWSGGCTGTASCVVATDTAAAITATFNKKKYALSITKAGNGAGTITSAPAGISCGATCAFNFDSGAMVTLTPAASPGSTFTSWSGACTGSGACTVAITAAKSVTATFTLIPETLTVTKNGTGAGTVTSTPAGISCGTTCTASFNYNQSVTLTPAVTAGSTFTGWTGACTGTAACVVAMTTARAVTATFTKNTNPLSCTTVTNAKACTNGSLPEIALTGLTAAQCHDQCAIKMPQAGMTSGCWIVAMNATCYCRNGTLDTTAGTSSGGSCN